MTHHFISYLISVYQSVNHVKLTILLRYLFCIIFTALVISLYVVLRTKLKFHRSCMRAEFSL